jgi:hypothetical protein
VKSLPYRTRARLETREHLVGVEVRSVKPEAWVRGLRVEHAVRWRPVEALVDGERQPRLIAVERLEERP